jgi:hypothetical protein
MDDRAREPHSLGDRVMREYKDAFREFSVSQLAREVLRGSLTDGIPSTFPGHSPRQ